jgi:hypothetical protein
VFIRKEAAPYWNTCFGLRAIQAGTEINSKQGLLENALVKVAVKVNAKGENK